jgi:hypothetical protein
MLLFSDIANSSLSFFEGALQLSDGLRKSSCSTHQRSGELRDIVTSRVTWIRNRWRGDRSKIRLLGQFPTSSGAN